MGENIIFMQISVKNKACHAIERSTMSKKNPEETARSLFSSMGINLNCLPHRLKICTSFFALLIFSRSFLVPSCFKN